MTIKILHQQGKSQRAIAKQLGISRHTVKKYLLQDVDEPTYQSRPETPHTLSPFKCYIKGRIESALPIQYGAVVIKREIKELGYDGDITR